MNTRVKTMDVLLEVLNARSVVPDRLGLPIMDYEVTKREVLENVSKEWSQFNTMRDIEGNLDWTGLIMASVAGALSESDNKVQRKRLLEAAAMIVAAIESTDA